MSFAMILSTVVVVTQPITSTPGPEPVIFEQREVAYEELTNGMPAEAAAVLEAKLQQDPQDPATLINLGTAYARLGETARAAQTFRAAMTSRTRYQLELADGSWDDSRDLARRALRSIEQTPSLAALGE